jgi:hypothetical protein
VTNRQAPNELPLRLGDAVDLAQRATLARPGGRDGVDDDDVEIFLRLLDGVDVVARVELVELADLERDEVGIKLGRAVLRVDEADRGLATLMLPDPVANPLGDLDPGEALAVAGRAAQRHRLPVVLLDHLRSLASSESSVTR